MCEYLAGGPCTCYEEWMGDMGPCLCGDYGCPSCGPAQGVFKDECTVCGEYTVVFGLAGECEACLEANMVEP